MSTQPKCECGSIDVAVNTQDTEIKDGKILLKCHCLKCGVDFESIDGEVTFQFKDLTNPKWLMVILCAVGLISIILVLFWGLEHKKKADAKFAKILQEAYKEDELKKIYTDPQTKCQYWDKTMTERNGTDGHPLCLNQIDVGN